MISAKSIKVAILILRCLDGPSDLVNFFGDSYNKVNAASKDGFFYNFFGGKTMAFKFMEMMIKPKG